MIRLDQPERNLLAAAIRQANRELIGSVPEDVFDAVAFFILPGSRLAWMCHLLDLDLDTVRERAREQAMARLEWLRQNPGSHSKTQKARAAIRERLAIALVSGEWRLADPPRAR